MAGWTIAAREAFAAAIGFVAYGLLLTVVWVRLAAPDVALTEAAIGSGLTGGLLIGACARLRAGEAAAAAEAPSAALRVAAAVLCILVTAGLAGVVLLLPDPAPTLAPAAMASIGSTGLGNPVTAVLLAYRALDTLLEVVVLLLALLGVWSLAPDRLWGGYPGPRHYADRDGVLAFAGPVAAAIRHRRRRSTSSGSGGRPRRRIPGRRRSSRRCGCWSMMAGLAQAPAVGRRRLRLMLVAGPAVFLAVGLAGFVTAGAFWPTRSATPSR